MLADTDASSEAIEEFSSRTQAMVTGYQQHIDDFLTSDLPGREVVPLAIYYRYLRRIVANLVGVVRTSAEPLPFVDYLEGGTVDTDD